MVECWQCGEEYEWDEFVEFDCPECGETDMGEGFIQCENCGVFIDYNGDEWICQNCDNEGVTEEELIAEMIPEREVMRCPECGAEIEDDCYCDYCGWPNNQGWIGENY